MSQTQEPAVVRTVRTIQKDIVAKRPMSADNAPKGLPSMEGNEDHTDPEYPTRSTYPDKPMWMASDTISGSGHGQII